MHIVARSERNDVTDIWVQEAQRGSHIHSFINLLAKIKILGDVVYLFFKAYFLYFFPGKSFLNELNAL